MALLQLYCDAKALDTSLPDPMVATIDHGLRQGVDAEIALVAGFCARQNIPHHVATWQGEKPIAGIMAKARIARYQLLSEIAQKVDANTILTGHSFDDQQETLWMRQKRNADYAGAMEQLVLFERKTLLARPLLMQKRANLRKYLTDKNIKWVDDPSNQDIRFERIQARKALEAVKDLNVQDHAQKDFTDNAARTVLLGMQAAQCIALYFKAADQNKTRFSVSSEALAHISDEALITAMRYGVAVLGGLEYPPSPKSGDVLLELLKNTTNGMAFTVGHCVATRMHDGLIIQREKRHLLANGPAAQLKLTPFEQFLPQSRLEMANALAKAFKKPLFVWPYAG